MSNSFLYRDGSSALHRLDPGIKLCLLAWVVCSHSKNARTVIASLGVHCGAAPKFSMREV